MISHALLVPPSTNRPHKVRGAEDAWNSRDPDLVAQVDTEDTIRRNRVELPVGRGVGALPAAQMGA